MTLWLWQLDRDPKVPASAKLAEALAVYQDIHGRAPVRVWCRPEVAAALGEGEVEIVTRDQLLDGAVYLEHPEGKRP